MRLIVSFRDSSEDCTAIQKDYHAIREKYGDFTIVPGFSSDVVDFAVVENQNTVVIKE